jgi:hypothetical protein
MLPGLPLPLDVIRFRVLGPLTRLGPALRRVCKDWDAFFGAQFARPGSCQLSGLAAAGYQALLVWIHEERTGFSKKQADRILARAAEGGHEALCRLAKDWGATSFDPMLTQAALRGHEALCRLAKDWGAAKFNGMLESAAQGGHEALCRQAKEWGATNFDVMLASAVWGGHEAICRLAKEWGAARFDRMLVYAVSCGDEALCRLAIEWGAADPGG